MADFHGDGASFQPIHTSCTHRWMMPLPPTLPPPPFPFHSVQQISPMLPYSHGITPNSTVFPLSSCACRRSPSCSTLHNNLLFPYVTLSPPSLIYTTCSFHGATLSASTFLHFHQVHQTPPFSLVHRWSFSLHNISFSALHITDSSLLFLSREGDEFIPSS